MDNRPKFNSTTYGIPEMNHRDASGSYVSASAIGARIDGQGSTSGAWKHDRTPVQVPGATRQVPPRAVGANPFTNRMTSNLKSSARRNDATPGPSITDGNRTRKNTPLGQYTNQSRKRQKLDTASSSRSDAQASSSSSKYFPGTAGKSIREPVSHELGVSDMQPIDIDDDGTDRGVVVDRHSLAVAASNSLRRSSPDPLDCLNSSAPNSPPRDLQPNRQGRRPAADGAATQRLRKQRQDVQYISSQSSDAPESIQSFSDSETRRNITPRGTILPQGNVLAKLKMYNALPAKSSIPEKLPLPEKRPSPEKLPPIIDLNAIKPIGSRKSQMRAKNEPFVRQLVGKTGPVAQKDPIATSSSGFVAGTKKTKNAKRGVSTIILPVEQLVYGIAHLPDSPDSDLVNPPFWLIYEPLTRMFEIRVDRPDGLIHCQLDVKHISQIEHTANSAQDPIVLHMTTGPSGTRAKVNEDSPFQPGKGICGLITVKFLTKHANWTNDNSFDQLIEALPDGKRNTMVGCASASCWEAAVGRARVGTETDTKAPRTSINNEESSLSVSSRPAVSSGPKPRPIPKPISRNAEVPKEPIEKRRSTRLSRPSSSEIVIDPEPDPEPDDLILVYPSTGAGGVRVNKSDLKRLQPDEYLNDTLIEFGLKLWLNTLRERQPELAEQVHVFSSFFYKKLNVKNKEEGYQSVRKWTQKFDLFQKRYIIVPINENFHWYLAMICNPHHILEAPPSVSTPLTRKRKRDLEVEPVEPVKPVEEVFALPVSDGEEIIPDSQPGTPAPTNTVSSADSDGDGEIEVAGMLGTRSRVESHPPRPINSAIDVDEMELGYPSSPSPSCAHDRMDVDDLPLDVQMADISITTPGIASTSSLSLSDTPKGPGPAVSDSVAPATFYGAATSKKGKERAHSIRSDVVKDGQDVDVEESLSDTGIPDHSTTYILTFDSLGGRHQQVINTLAKYLELEAKDKKGIGQASEAKGKIALVPPQPNYCDCGVYVLHFVRTFFQDPDRFYQLIMSMKPREYSVDKRQKDWGSHLEVNRVREELAGEIRALSEGWKKERECKEGQRRKEAEGSKTGSATPALSVVDSSDDEIIIGEVKQASPKGKATAKRQKRASAKVEMQPAARLRDSPP